MIKKLFQKINFAELPLEHTIFVLIVLSEIIISAVSVAVNIQLGLSSITVVILLVNIVLNIGCMAYSIRTKKWFMPAALVILYAVLALFPLLWFSSGGATGSTMPYLVMSSFIGAIMFRGKFRNFLFVIVPSLFSFFIFLELRYPDIYVPYPSREAQYIDLIIGLVITFTVTAVLAVTVLSRYREAKLKSEELAKRLGEISVTDPLTGLYNRRMLTSGLDEAMRKCYETGLPLAICIIDIDHFKQVNDVYGHLCGDKVLIELAQLLKSFMGENDLLGRYGGEEFLIVFKDQTLEEAFQTVEKFHQAVQEHNWTPVPQITISCGMSAYRKGISYSEFVGGADKRLYEAKETGRNRIVYR